MMTETLPRDAAGEGGDLPLPEIDYRFIATFEGKSMECETREEARAWIAHEREVSGNLAGSSRIEQVEV